MLLPCGHSGYCGACAQSLFANSAGDASCGQCPVCRAPLTAVVKVPVDTPVGSSGNILEVSAGSFGATGISAGGGTPTICCDSETQDRQTLELLGPNYTVNPIAEFGSFRNNNANELIKSSAKSCHAQHNVTMHVNMHAKHACKGEGKAPLKRESADGVKKADSSMENVASFMVWEEQASETGTSGSRQSIRKEEAERQAAENNPIAFW